MSSPVTIFGSETRFMHLKIKYAKYKIAFCAKPILKQAANIIIDEKNLALIPQKLAQFN